MKQSGKPLSSNRPYLLRAIYEWLLDNNLTPQILVDARQAGVQVPEQHVKDGQILLNINNTAVQNLLMDNHGVFFNARFSGNPMQINIPIPAVLAIFSRENGQGMAFPDEATTDEALMDEIVTVKDSEVEISVEDAKISSVKTPKKNSKPTLKIVK